MVVFDPAAGRLGGRGAGLLALPGREAEYIATVRDAIALANRIGTTRLNGWSAFRLPA